MFWSNQTKHNLEGILNFRRGLRRTGLKIDSSYSKGISTLLQRSAMFVFLGQVRCACAGTSQTLGLRTCFLHMIMKHTVVSFFSEIHVG